MADASRFLLRSRRLAPGEPGVLVEVTPAQAGWAFVHFTVRRVTPGTPWRGRTERDECCLVLLSGTCRITYDEGPAAMLGPRLSVFDSYPHAMYLPAGHTFSVDAQAVCEIAECRAPSDTRLEPRVIRPAECGFEIRGGGNATRQIVDILPPAFPADRLLICEVYTPSGNWSSYPPHKHDVDNPPGEVDLEETYYFRLRGLGGYGFQRIYTSDGRTDETLKVEDGDLVLIREGYHPFVTAFGYDAYYLNVLAGTRRSMASSDDPRYAAIRQAWPPPDPRMPMLERPAR